MEFNPPANCPAKRIANMQPKLNPTTHKHLSKIGIPRTNSNVHHRQMHGDSFPSEIIPSL